MIAWHGSDHLGRVLLPDVRVKVFDEVRVFLRVAVRFSVSQLSQLLFGTRGPTRARRLTR